MEFIHRKAVWDNFTREPPCLHTTKHFRRASLHETISHLCFLSKATFQLNIMMPAWGLLQTKMARKITYNIANQPDFSQIAQSPNMNRWHLSCDAQTWAHIDPKLQLFQWEFSLTGRSQVEDTVYRQKNTSKNDSISKHLGRKRLNLWLVLTV